MIRNVRPGDAARICAVYNHYVEKTIITFEESPVSESEMESRIAEISSAFPWLVYEEDGRVIAYAYAGKWKGRSAYRYSVESTVYVDKDCGGRGIGTQLYSLLLEKLRELRMHAVIGGIALPNEKSRKLHEKFGFKKVAHFSEVGYKFDTWIDVGYWELVLE